MFIQRLRVVPPLTDTLLIFLFTLYFLCALLRVISMLGLHSVESAINPIQCIFHVICYIAFNCRILTWVFCIAFGTFGLFSSFFNVWNCYSLLIPCGLSLSSVSCLGNFQLADFFLHDGSCFPAALYARELFIGCQTWWTGWIFLYS